MLYWTHFGREGEVHSPHLAEPGKVDYKYCYTTLTRKRGEVLHRHSVRPCYDHQKRWSHGFQTVTFALPASFPSLPPASLLALVLRALCASASWSEGAWQCGHFDPVLIQVVLCCNLL